MPLLESLVGATVIGLTRLFTGNRVLWREPPAAGRRVYFGNHTSHGDFLLIWAALPAAVRARTRPVAAADYWGRDALRRYLIKRVFNGVLIEREAAQRDQDPVGLMVDAIDAGAALILFPEGRRNQGAEMLPFKTGIYHLARQCADLEFVPVWLENTNRAMPKGHFLPLPLLCTTRFGAPLRLAAGEDKQVFLERARAAVLALAPAAAP